MTDHFDVIEQALARLHAGDPVAAAALLQDGIRRFPNEPDLPLNLSLARRMMRDLPGALEALDAALAIDPYFFMALLSKGVIVEQLGDQRQAARLYANAVKIAPNPDSLPLPARQALERAKQVVAANNAALLVHLQTAGAAVKARFPDADFERMDECAAILAGVAKPYVQEALFMTVPRLPAIPFYSREYFPWFATLEASAAIIRDEALTALEQAFGRFDAYIQRNKGDPLNQWAELNGNKAWSTLHLWRDGHRDDSACALLPQTAALLDTLPLARQAGFGPTAMVSVLQPRTRIPAHTGSSNARLICHLPLSIPPHCRFRVGNVTREWRPGEAFVFDDTIEHEAWNESDAVRTVLIFDVWNPLLSDAEREMTTVLANAARAYSQGG